VDRTPVQVDPPLVLKRRSNLLEDFFFAAPRPSFKIEVLDEILQGRYQRDP
jgi:hypothetical protein